ncbi:MAG: hypothetical protein H6822_22060 [Planctomycetaceae bacterium]|nr:hypothetical protein [Planctomycetaceae bacterium]
MKLGVAAATQIAAFICGEKGTPFPYKTGRELTLFFTGLGHGYRIEGHSSRGNLAETALVEIDRQTGDEDSEYPSPEIVEILEELMSPTAFEASDDPEADYPKALKAINRVLGRTNLQIVLINGRPTVQTTEGMLVSTASKSIKSVTKLMFVPSVFQIPDDPEPKDDLVAVMMPFEAAFEGVFKAINRSCSELDLRCFRVKDIWKESQIIQDIFELILVSRIVVVDFSEENTNVFYEAGIAHTLGKEVVPLAQSVKNDVPFDLRSHRVIEYKNNEQGLREMSQKLKKRLRTILDGHDWNSISMEDDIPF